MVALHQSTKRVAKKVFVSNPLCGQRNATKTTFCIKNQIRNFESDLIFFNPFQLGFFPCCKASECKTGEKEAVIPSEADDLEQELTKMPELRALFADNPEEPFNTDSVSQGPANSPSRVQRGTDYLPESLYDALFSLKGCLWNRLFRFAVKLRNDHGGCDVAFLKNARNARMASRTLNWHQWPGKKMINKCKQIITINYI